MHKMELNCLFKMHHPSNHKMPKNKNSPPSEKPSNDPWAPFHPPVMQKCIFKQKKVSPEKVAKIYRQNLPKNALAVTPKIK